jgi:uncharacterized protein YcfJ
MKKILFILLSISITSANAETIQVPVTSHTEIYKISRVEIPSTTYEEEQVQVPYPCGNTIETNSIGWDTLVGSVLGVAIGNQIGGGSGRDVAKVLGGLSGGYIANQHRGSEQTCYRMEFRSKPNYTVDYESRERLVAYNNCGYLGNRKICKKAKHKKDFIYITY